MNSVFAWRSMLFVPVTNQRFIQSALRRPADALLLDLEDSIALEQKEEARHCVAPIAERCRDHHHNVIVRVNRPWRMLIRDIEAAVCQSVQALVLPKVPNAEFVHAVADMVDEVEAEKGVAAGSTRLIVMIEDAEGLHNMNRIATAHPRLCGLTIGAEDLAASMQMTVDDDSLYVPNVMAIAACRRAGIAPIGFVGSVAEFSDEQKFKAVVERASRLGFEGAFCIHPAQIGLANDAFTPTTSAVERAKALVRKFEEEKALGRAVCTFDGKMVDAPVVKQAMRIIEKAQAFTGERPD